MSEEFSTGESTESKPKRKKRRNRTRRTFGAGASLERSSSRHQARILAMQALYEFDTAEHDIDDIVGRFQMDADVHSEDPSAATEEDEVRVDEIPPEVAVYAERLARGVVDALPEIDPILVEAAPAFPLEQIASVDRNVLRLAIFELLHEADVPQPVAINEAIEIAKHFGGPNSGRFVNGVLGTVARRLPDNRQKPVEQQQ